MNQILVIGNPNGSDLLLKLEKQRDFLIIVNDINECDRHNNMKKHARGILPIRKVCEDCMKIIKKEEAK